ncbi:hypothetical protein BDW74DRAFT_169674 [Aspergillus multicolor]|uniref:flavin-containing monooxygenase n=1 Tax=Aspergillus multicolor TaxID=41759 RepID=UPI003CCCCC99
MNHFSQTSPASNPLNVDVVIIGAGISGINVAYYLQTNGPPGLSYAILEARSNLGGTWDLFRYPGVRSDSDIHTFRFGWNPWVRETEAPLAPGGDILEYLKESSRMHRIDKHIVFNRRVESADWDSQHCLWNLDVAVADACGRREVVQCRFMVLATGYYDYDEPLDAYILGLELFDGTVVHLQFWPSNLTYDSIEMLIIGSGATAVTLLPSVADRAKHVTMLQRSPTYILPLPMQDRILRVLRALFPSSLAATINRLRFAVFGYLQFLLCRLFSNAARWAFKRIVTKQLPSNVKWDPHFNPRYNPWDQRLCACPDGDFYAAIRSGKASVNTGVIQEITRDEIRLESGGVLHPDIIVTATGLKVRFAGAIKLSVDGGAIDPSKKFIWRGTMQLRRKNASYAVPRLENPESMPRRPLFELPSTYARNASRIFPVGGVGHWSKNRNYLLDILRASFGDISSGLEMH